MPFCKRSSKCILLNEKYCILIPTSLKLVLEFPINNKPNMNAGDGFVSTRRQAIIWTIVGIVYWRIYASLGLGKLTCWCTKCVCLTKHLPNYKAILFLNITLVHFSNYKQNWHINHQEVHHNNNFIYNIIFCKSNRNTSLYNITAIIYSEHSL